MDGVTWNCAFSGCLVHRLFEDAIYFCICHVSWFLQEAWQGTTGPRGRLEQTRSGQSASGVGLTFPRDFLSVIPFKGICFSRSLGSSEKQTIQLDENKGSDVSVVLPEQEMINQVQTGSRSHTNNFDKNQGCLRSNTSTRRGMGERIHPVASTHDMQRA